MMVPSSNGPASSFVAAAINRLGWPSEEQKLTETVGEIQFTPAWLNIS